MCWNNVQGNKIKDTIKTYILDKEWKNCLKHWATPYIGEQYMLINFPKWKKIERRKTIVGFCLRNTMTFECTWVSLEEASYLSLETWGHMLERSCKMSQWWNKYLIHLFSRLFNTISKPHPLFQESDPSTRNRPVLSNTSRCYTTGKRLLIGQRLNKRKSCIWSRSWTPQPIFIYKVLDVDKNVWFKSNSTFTFSSFSDWLVH